MVRLRMVRRSSSVLSRNDSDCARASSSSPFRGARVRRGGAMRGGRGFVVRREAKEGSDGVQVAVGMSGAWIFSAGVSPSPGFGAGNGKCDSGPRGMETGG